jgi:general stress protein 26
MSMRKVKALMKEAATGFLATTDGRRAQVRPMSACAWFGDELWMATARKSRKAADVRSCPRAEICFMAADYRHVRIAGRVKTSERTEDKRRLFKAFAWMACYFDSPEDPGWVVLRMTPSSIRLMDSAAMEYREVLR